MRQRAFARYSDEDGWSCTLTQSGDVLGSAVEARLYAPDGTLATCCGHAPVRAVTGPEARRLLRISRQLMACG